MLPSELAAVPWPALLVSANGGQDFMAIVAHDLRTPLQSVLMQIEALLARSSGTATSVAHSTQLMKRNGQRLDRLVRDLLDASQIDAHGVILDCAPVNLPEVASSLVLQLHGVLETHAVVIEVTGEPPLVSADRPRLEQIMSNLLENASKYSREGTPIRVIVAPSGRGATVSVRDEGPGIAPEELPRLFDRYFQTQRARARRRGLFITKGLVESHGGTIDVESVPGAGSTFRIWLPAAS
jgi:signal transduction histidine kinase